ncbi:hypothetical protein MHM39_13395 [Phaeobacter sp. CNT1-3]|nr:hypothetical protein [Phaeobacter sp. CNT1-3]
MHIILGALSFIAVIYFWVIRARNAADATQGVLETANDVRLAARRFGFKRRSNMHSVDAVEDPIVAAAALAVAFLELDDFPTAEQKSALTSALRENLQVSHQDAEELITLGHWLTNECQGAVSAVPRLSRRLYRLSGQDHFVAVTRSLQMLVRFGTGHLSAKQQDALNEMSRIMKMA